jgi:hypothetical protein
MKSIPPLVLATAFLLGMTSILAARAVRIWPYQELLKKSDLAVIAAPAATNDTKEHIDLPGFPGEHVIGVETRFTVSAVLKGDKAIKDFVLHHYRTADGTNIPHVPNGPSFLAFPQVENPTSVQRTYILFLLREADGRYAPVVGQTDPGLGIKELVSACTGSLTRRCGGLRQGGPEVGRWAFQRATIRACKGGRFVRCLSHESDCETIRGSARPLL